MDLLNSLSFMAGILIFVYGIMQCSKHFENMMSFQLRHYLNAASNNRFRAVIGGFIFTLFTQSSSATSVIIITLVSSGLIALPAALTMVIGAGIGASLTVQIIAFDIYDWSIVFCGLGILITLFRRFGPGKSLGEGIFCFGLIFLGMKVMSESIAPLQDSPFFVNMLESLCSTPLAGLAFASIFTALIQTSSATLSIIISLISIEAIPVESAMALALGANIGTCATAIISSVGENIDSKRVAYGFVMIKVLGVLIIYPFISLIAALLPLVANNPARQVAHFHTFFNLFLLVFVPCTGWLALLLEKILPQRLLGKNEFRPKFLDTNALISPSLAMANAHREVARMADIVNSMMRYIIKAMGGMDQGLIKKIEKLENHVDILNRDIKLYLTKLSRSDLTEKASRREMNLITFTVNLEHIADIIESSLLTKARKRLLLGIEFSEKGWEDIVGFHELVLNNFNLAIGAFVEQDYSLARQVLAQKSKLSELEGELRQAHINRLHKGLPESIDTSSLHMDILRDLQQINSFIVNIIYPIIEAGDPRARSHSL